MSSQVDAGSSYLSSLFPARSSNTEHISTSDDKEKQFGIRSVSDTSGFRQETAAILACARADDTPGLLEALAASMSDKTIPLRLGELRDDEGHTAIHWAAIHADRPALAALLALDPAAVDTPSMAPAQKGQTPLHWAAVAGHTATVATLIDSHGASPENTDDRGYNALIHAAQYGHIDVCHVLLLRAPQLCRTVDAEQHSALHWAAYFGHHRVAVYLLHVHKDSVDINATDSLGFTALHRAAQQGHDLVCRALLAAGADRTLRDSSMRTALDIAPPMSRVRASLLELDPQPSQRARLKSDVDRLPYSHGSASSDLKQSRAKRLLSFLNAPRPSIASLRSSVVRLSSIPGMSIFASTSKRLCAKGYWLILVYHIVLIASYSCYLGFVHPVVAPSLLFDVIFHVAIITSVVCANISTFRSPGYIPRGSVEDLVQHLNDAIAVGKSDSVLSPSVYCYTCFTRRLPRSVHSREVDRCVLRFDHVCPFVNNQIGLRNHRALVLFAGSVAVAQWMFMYVSFVALFAEARKVMSFSAPFLNHPVMSALLIVHAGLSVFAATLFVGQVKVICMGMTTYEYLNSKRQKQTHNPYNRGCLRNVLQFVTMSGPGTSLQLESNNSVSRSDTLP